MHDVESPKRQKFEVECEKGGERDRNEDSQDWSALDPEMQHECADSHQRTGALLGWSRGLNGLLGNFGEGCEMSGTSVVEVAAALLEGKWRETRGQDRTQSGSTSADGRIWYRRRYPKSVETQMALRNLSNCPRDGYILLRIVGNGGSSQKFGKARPRRCHCDDTYSGVTPANSGVQAHPASWWKDFD